MSKDSQGTVAASPAVKGTGNGTAQAVSDRMAAARNARGSRVSTADLSGVSKSAISKLRQIRNDAKLAIDTITEGVTDSRINLADLGEALAAVARCVQM